MNKRELSAVVPGDRSSAAFTLGASSSFTVAVWLSPSLLTVKALVGGSLRARTVSHAQLIAALFG